MLSPGLTPRRRIIELLTGTLLSSHQLAQLLGMPERQVEDHLTHIVKTLSRDPARTFLLGPDSLVPAAARTAVAKLLPPHDMGSASTIIHSPSQTACLQLPMP